jgi:hypothetical protein
MYSFPYILLILKKIIYHGFLLTYFRQAALRTCQEIMLSLASRRPPSQFIVDLSKPIQDKRTTKDSLDIENLQPSKACFFLKPAQ